MDYRLTGSMYYMRTSFVEGLYFGRWCLTRAKSLRLRLNLCCCTSKACNYKKTIVMAAAMTSCSTAILAAERILQILH